MPRRVPVSNCDQHRATLELIRNEEGLIHKFAGFVHDEKRRGLKKILSTRARFQTIQQNAICSLVFRDPWSQEEMSENKKIPNSPLSLWISYPQLGWCLHLTLSVGSGPLSSSAYFIGSRLHITKASVTLERESLSAFLLRLFCLFY